MLTRFDLFWLPLKCWWRVTDLWRQHPACWWDDGTGPVWHM